MLHTKFHGNRPAGSGEEDFLRFLPYNGHGGHLGHVTWTIYTFGLDWPSGFRGEDV